VQPPAPLPRTGSERISGAIAESLRGVQAVTLGCVTHALRKDRGKPVTHAAAPHRPALIGRRVSYRSVNAREVIGICERAGAALPREQRGETVMPAGGQTRLTGSGSQFSAAAGCSAVIVSD
jgi:hypothetical protein